jgi:hypothetical protein
MSETVMGSNPTVGFEPVTLEKNGGRASSPDKARDSCGLHVIFQCVLGESCFCSITPSAKSY